MSIIVIQLHPEDPTDGNTFKNCLDGREIAVAERSYSGLKENTNVFGPRSTPLKVAQLRQSSYRTSLPYERRPRRPQSKSPILIDGDAHLPRSVLLVDPANRRRPNCVTDSPWIPGTSLVEISGRPR